MPAGGIGRTTALALAGKEVKRALFGRTKSKLDEVASSVRALSGRVGVVEGDVTDVSARTAAIGVALDPVRGLNFSRGQSHAMKAATSSGMQKVPRTSVGLLMA